MKTQADFELTAEEINELKALLDPPYSSVSTYSGLSQITDIDEFKKCLLKIESLVLGDKRVITLIPNSIQYLKNLEFISINHPSITTLPENITQLKNLRHLALGHLSKIVKLPKNIGQLQQLEKLYLHNCPMKELPESIFQLNNLKELFLSNHKITALSEQIGNLHHLQKLELSCGKLKTLPESIGELKQLKTLDLTGCISLTTLPESIGKLNNLHTLHIDNCPNLTTLPENLNYLAFGNQKQEEQSDIEMAMKEIDKLIAEFENQTQAPTATVQMENGKEVVNLAQFLKELKNHINTDEMKAIIDRRQEPQAPKLTPEQVSAILDKLHKQTAQPAIKINIQEADDLPLTASKFGGVPYWLPEMPYPVDKQGNKLLLLAQINLSEMPPLPDFPTTGLLQFLMTQNVYEMNFYNNPTRQDDWRVVYHAEINPAIDESSVLALNIPYAPQIFDDEDDGGFPVDTQYRLSFEPAEIRIGTECIGFDKALKNAAKEVGIKLNKNDLSDLEVLFGEKAWEKIKQHTVENLIGGYPDFTQTDPRDERKYKKHSVLLLQIESDEGIMWGDCGVGNFFIRPDDLRKKDFSKVLFNWDCC